MTWARTLRGADHSQIPLRLTRVVDRKGILKNPASSTSGDAGSWQSTYGSPQALQFALGFRVKPGLSFCLGILLGLDFGLGIDLGGGDFF